MSEYIINLDGELGMVLAVACASAGFQHKEVVRCRDCKYFRIKPNYDVCVFTDKYARHDGFCAWGKRRTEN